MKRDLSYLFGLAASGGLTVPIGGRFALADAADAHRQLQDRTSIGKLVLHC
jgi:NADPH2:quinone reductase